MVVVWELLPDKKLKQPEDMPENSNDFDPAVRETILNEAAASESFPEAQPIVNASCSYLLFFQL